MAYTLKKSPCCLSTYISLTCRMFITCIHVNYHHHTPAHAQDFITAIKENVVIITKKQVQIRAIQLELINMGVHIHPEEEVTEEEIKADEPPALEPVEAEEEAGLFL